MEIKPTLIKPEIFDHLTRDLYNSDINMGVPKGGGGPDSGVFKLFFQEDCINFFQSFV